MSSNLIGQVELLSRYKGETRVPVFSLAQYYCAHRKGLPPALIHHDPRRSYALQQDMNEAIGFDSPPFYSFATYGSWEWGVELPYASSELCEIPVLPHYPVTAPDDIENLVLPPVGESGMLPNALEFSRLQDELGDPITVVLGGVYTVAANICGMDRLILWMIERPELVHRILDFSRRHLLDIVQLWGLLFGYDRVTPIIREEIANANILSPRHFRDFVLPHQRWLNEQILQLGVRSILCHICGPQRQQLAMWAQIPMGKPGILSFGAETTFADASTYFPAHILMGNIDPVLLRTGTPETVRFQVMDCIAQGMRHPSGFVLAPGCDLQFELPADNLQVLVDAARY